MTNEERIEEIREVRDIISQKIEGGAVEVVVSGTTLLDDLLRIAEERKAQLDQAKAEIKIVIATADVIDKRNQAQQSEITRLREALGKIKVSADLFDPHDYKPMVLYMVEIATQALKDETNQERSE